MSNGYTSYEGYNYTVSSADMDAGLRYIILVATSYKNIATVLYRNGSQIAYLHNLTGSSNPALISGAGVFLFNNNFKAGDTFKLSIGAASSKYQCSYVGIFAK